MRNGERARSTSDGRRLCIMVGCHGTDAEAWDFVKALCYVCRVLFLNIWTDASSVLSFSQQVGKLVRSLACRRHLNTANPPGSSTITRLTRQRRQNHAINQEDMDIVSSMLSCSYRDSSHGRQRADGRNGRPVIGTGKLGKSSTTTLSKFSFTHCRQSSQCAIIDSLVLWMLVR